MADVAGSVVPSALDQKGNTTIWFTPTIADVNAPTVIEIGATGSYRLTYDFTADGFNFAGSQDTVDDDRLTLAQPLQSLDVNKVTLDLKYVQSADTHSAQEVLVSGTSGYFVVRQNVPDTNVIAADDLVRVIPVTLGVQNSGPIDGNGKSTIAQKCAIGGVVGDPVAVVAGS